ncbi:2-polyprenyl-6-methoxyphenol hydroxylase-like FAD-dependent oxidoreductase [Chitinophaga polysaccharea]|uniref:2-polyprenyl-6-methoxyphenol hydroxylase-like FAD-dependent oxidoreductase n=1 Tax=Chitinophaga polysaccharea TaxID=1293035 RepID=A0A561PNX0_9BACT|nr:FAD-dependent monooxygenase [Chitinophaga polysaccharea]TWF39816.1 2-polyprenyl-6-methoxyphenol hydroxylase-like FAD-dependent oxidoreductase [Chitinophaga polysaccharea]
MKAIIIGAGIGGLTTAIALQQQQIQFEIYEAAPELKAVGAGIWLGGNAMNVYERLGLADALKAPSIFLESVFIKDVKGQLLQFIDNLDIQQRYGNATHAIHRGTLQQILANAVKQPIHLGKRCVGINGNVVRFEDGTTDSADVIIGADGIRSVVREQYVTKAQYRYSGQTCWRAIINTTLPPSEQVSSGEVWSRKGGVRASISQVGDQQVYFWMTKAMPAGSKFSPAEALTFIRRELAPFDLRIQDIVSRLDPDALIHGDLYDIQPLKQWYRGNVVLVGDAAHASTPNLGQGASQAIEDAYVLAAYLGQESRPERTFAKYQARRLKRAKRVVDLSWMLGRLTSVKNTTGSLLRNYLIRHTPHRIARKQFDFLYGVDLNIE